MLIGGSSAFNLDKLDINVDVARLCCSRLSNANGFVGNVIFAGVCTSGDVGTMADKFVVDCGRDTV